MLTTILEVSHCIVQGPNRWSMNMSPQIFILATRIEPYSGSSYMVQLVVEQIPVTETISRSANICWPFGPAINICLACRLAIDLVWPEAGHNLLLAMATTYWANFVHRKRSNGLGIVAVRPVTMANHCRSGCEFRQAPTLEIMASTASLSSFQ